MTRVSEIARSELGLDIYPNQIEVITAEQMLDAYSSVGMPLIYKHWSFGKHFAHHETLYRNGLKGLAYEIVINSSPCISYLMEENTATMQTLVIAHAAFGHNHFFKNNYLFHQWTDADGILEYLDFAKGYVARCEERYGRSCGRANAGRRACADVARGRSLSAARRNSIFARKKGAQMNVALTRRAPLTISGGRFRRARSRPSRN